MNAMRQCPVALQLALANCAMVRIVFATASGMGLPLVDHSGRSPLETAG
jgi:hypothetical protein